MTIPVLAKAPNSNHSEIPTWSDNYILPIYIPYVSKANLEPKRNFNPCSCVDFYKAVIGFQGTLGNARDILPTTDIPSVGSALLTDEGNGHIAIIVAITSKSYEIKEANYLPCQVSTRTIDKSNPHIRGIKL